MQVKKAVWTITKKDAKTIQERKKYVKNEYNANIRNSGCSIQSL